jgi:hypothetical protein
MTLHAGRFVHFAYHRNSSSAGQIMVWSVLTSSAAWRACAWRPGDSITEHAMLRTHILSVGTFICCAVER